VLLLYVNIQINAHIVLHLNNARMVLLIMDCRTHSKFPLWFLTGIKHALLKCLSIFNLSRIHQGFLSVSIERILKVWCLCLESWLFANIYWCELSFDVWVTTREVCLSILDTPSPLSHSLSFSLSLSLYIYIHPYTSVIFLGILYKVKKRSYISVYPCLYLCLWPSIDNQTVR
jgi:hypothetical protein